MFPEQIYAARVAERSPPYPPAANPRAGKMNKHLIAWKVKILAERKPRVSGSSAV
jgi:hypothetical protein